MKTFIHSSLMIALIFSANVQAENINSATALKLCKAKINNQYDDINKSRLKKVKKIRSGYQIKMNVVNGTEKFNALCEVDRDGSINLTTKS